jgi:hypothetical protein
LAHFCWGLLIVTEEKVKATEISYSDARSLVTFYRGFIFSPRDGGVLLQFTVSPKETLSL